MIRFDSIALILGGRRNCAHALRLAKQAFRRKDWAAAAQYYRTVVTLTPNDFGAWVQLGHALKEAAEFDAAAHAYREAEKLDGADIDLKIQLGHFNKGLGDRNAALRYYTDAISLGSVDEHARMFVEAEALAHKSALHVTGRPLYPGINPSSRVGSIARQKADAARDQGKLKLAIRLYQQATRDRPSDQTAFVQLGNCSKDLGLYLDAEKAYLRAIEIHPEDADCFLQLGHLYKLMHRQFSAMESYARSAELNPDRPDATREIALLHQIPVEIEASLLFERDWYLHEYPNVAASGGDPLQHYMLHGVTEGTNPNRLFDTAWYLSAYPDVDPNIIHPLVHYIQLGAAMGYDPHPFFRTVEFAAKHPSAVGGELTPLAAYLRDVLPRNPASFPDFSSYDVRKAIQANYRRLEHASLLSHIDLMTFRPRFVVLVDAPEGEYGTAQERLSGQVYRNFVVVDSVQAVMDTETLKQAGADFLLWLERDDTLDAYALYELASALNADPNLDLIYFDSEVIDERGHSVPFHKPDWSPDYLESCDYIGSAACMSLQRAATFLKDAVSRYDLTLRMTEPPGSILHIPLCLVSHAAAKPLSREREAIDISAITRRLARTQRSGHVTAIRSGLGAYDVQLSLKRQPLVSAIIPTAGRVIDYNGKRLDLIVDCIDSITRLSTYKNIEFIVIDNGDLDRDRLGHIQGANIKFTTYNLTEVNIAKKINLGVSHASGEIILILNDDVEPLTPDWIERMVSHLEKPHVGVVGAKLLYPTNIIQHAGVVACDGLPQHIRRGMLPDEDGYNFSTCAVHNYAAVTGAVSMVPAELFRQVGGYSEEFPINFNDIDFCYKVRRTGHFVVYEPQAVLTHYESVSVGKPQQADETERFLQTWAKVTEDPFYNGHCFTKNPPTFALSYTEPRY